MRRWVEPRSLRSGKVVIMGEMDLQSLDKDQIEKRQKRNREKRGLLDNWYLNICAWSEVAHNMHEMSLNRKSHKSSQQDLGRLNIAQIAAGYAFELCIKGIAIADDESTLFKVSSLDITGKHEVGKIFRCHLKSPRQQAISQYIEKHIVNSPGEFFSIVDNRLCDPKRKYWNFNQAFEPVEDFGFFEPKGMPILLKILQGFMGVYEEARKEWLNVLEKEEKALKKRRQELGN